MGAGKDGRGSTAAGVDAVNEAGICVTNYGQNADETIGIVNDSDGDQRNNDAAELVYRRKEARHEPMAIIELSLFTDNNSQSEEADEKSHRRQDGPICHPTPPVVVLEYVVNGLTPYHRYQPYGQRTRVNKSAVKAKEREQERDARQDNLHVGKDLWNSAGQSDGTVFELCIVVTVYRRLATAVKLGLAIVFCHLPQGRKPTSHPPTTRQDITVCS